MVISVWSRKNKSHSFYFILECETKFNMFQRISIKTMTEQNIVMIKNLWGRFQLSRKAFVFDLQFAGVLFLGS